MNDFLTDDRWQRIKRDEILVPEFYEKHLTEIMAHWGLNLSGRYCLVDKGSVGFREFWRLQKKGVDTIVYTADDEPVFIEEKIVKWPLNNKRHTAFALETQSCTVPGLEKPGWMEYCEANILLYCFEMEDRERLEGHCIDFPALKAWFWEQYSTFYRHRMKEHNKTETRLVPISQVKKNIKKYQQFESCAGRGSVMPSKQLSLPLSFYNITPTDEWEYTGDGYEPRTILSPSPFNSLAGHDRIASHDRKR